MFLPKLLVYLSVILRSGNKKPAAGSDGLQRTNVTAGLFPGVAAGLSAQDNPEHLHGEPEHPGHATRCQPGPEHDHLGVIGGHVLLEHAKHENEEADDQNGIDQQTDGRS